MVKQPTSENLYRAIQSNRCDEAEKLLKEGANVQGLHNDKLPLSMCHSTEMATLLLNNGALINAQDKKGRTALLLASSRYIDVAEVLLKRGADPDRGRIDKPSCLNKAVKKHIPGMIALLLESGATRWERSKEGTVYFGHLFDNFAMLLSKYPNFRSCGKFSKDEENNLKKMSKLIEKAQIDPGSLTSAMLISKVLRENRNILCYILRSPTLVEDDGVIIGDNISWSTCWEPSAAVDCYTGQYFLQDQLLLKTELTLVIPDIYSCNNRQRQIDVQGTFREITQSIYEEMDGFDHPQSFEGIHRERGSGLIFSETTQAFVSFGTSEFEF